MQDCHIGKLLYGGLYYALRNRVNKPLQACNNGLSLLHFYLVFIEIAFMSNNIKGCGDIEYSVWRNHYSDGNTI